MSAAYVLNEIHNKSLRNVVIKSLWDMTKDCLVLIEPGTPEGFSSIRNARELILKEAQKDDKDASRAHIVAPVCFAFRHQS